MLHELFYADIDITAQQSFTDTQRMPDCRFWLFNNTGGKTARQDSNLVDNLPIDKNVTDSLIDFRLRTV